MPITLRIGRIVHLCIDSGHSGIKLYGQSIVYQLNTPWHTLGCELAKKITTHAKKLS